MQRGGGGGGGGGGLPERARALSSATPTATLLVVCALVAVFVAQAFAGWDDYGAVCMSPYLAVSKGQVWRAFTSPLFHIGALHVFFNVLSFGGIGGAVERRLGTARFACALPLLAAVAGATDAALGAALGHPSLGGLATYPQGYYQCAVGFSGIVFAAVSIEVATGAASTRSVMGWFEVQAWAYPWALLLLWSLMLPQVSFLGHLSGLLAGWLFAKGYLEWALPSDAALARLEQAQWAQRCGAALGVGAYVPAMAGGTRAGWGSGALLPTWASGGGSGSAGAGTSGAPGGGTFPGTALTTGDAAFAAVSADKLGGGSVSALAGRAAELRAQKQPTAVRPAKESRDSGDSSSSGGGSSSRPRASRAGDGGGLAANSATSAPVSEALASLRSMGFDSGRAAHALEASGGDVARAVDILTSQR